jgi:hypothetical protein
LEIRKKLFKCLERDDESQPKDERLELLTIGLGMSFVVFSHLQDVKNLQESYITMFDLLNSDGKYQ